MAESSGERIIKYDGLSLWIAIGMGKVEGLVKVGIFLVNVDEIT